jgi:hypothetical protein
MDLTREKIKSLSNEKIIKIANILEKRDDWQINRQYADEQEIYETVIDGGEGQYVAIIQFLFGDYGLDPEYFIRHFDENFKESSPTCDEWALIMEIINE